MPPADRKVVHDTVGDDRRCDDDVRGRGASSPGGDPSGLTARPWPRTAADAAAPAGHRGRPQRRAGRRAPRARARSHPSSTTRARFVRALPAERPVPRSRIRRRPSGAGDPAPTGPTSSACCSMRRSGGATSCETRASDSDSAPRAEVVCARAEDAARDPGRRASLRRGDGAVVRAAGGHRRVRGRVPAARRRDPGERAAGARSRPLARRRAGPTRACVAEPVAEAVPAHLVRLRAVDAGGSTMAPAGRNPAQTPALVAGRRRAAGVVFHVEQAARSASSGGSTWNAAESLATGRVLTYPAEHSSTRFSREATC